MLRGPFGRWPPLNNFILFAILLNCIFLTFEDPVCQCSGGRSQSTCSENELFKRVRRCIVFAYVGGFWPLIMLCSFPCPRPQILFVGVYWEKDSPLSFWHHQGSSASINCKWQESTEQVVWIGEIAFTAIFLLEMIIKIVARGFIMHKHAYLRDALNWLDFIVVISGTISVLSDLMNFPKNSMSQVFPHSCTSRRTVHLCMLICACASRF